LINGNAEDRIARASTVAMLRNETSSVTVGRFGRAKGESEIIR